MTLRRFLALAASGETRSTEGEEGEAGGLRDGGDGGLQGDGIGWPSGRVIVDEFIER